MLGLNETIDQICNGKQYSLVWSNVEERGWLLARLINSQDVVFRGFGRRSP